MCTIMTYWSTEGVQKGWVATSVGNEQAMSKGHTPANHTCLSCNLPNPLCNNMKDCNNVDALFTRTNNKHKTGILKLEYL